MGLGIMGTMEMARNAMRTARAGAEVSGNNLANASNPTYARQRIKVNSAITIPTKKVRKGPVPKWHAWSKYATRF